MAQDVDCPDCGKVISLPDSAVGKKVKCGDCEAVCRIHENSEGDFFLEVLDEGAVIPDKPSPSAPRSGRQSQAAAPRSRSSSRGSRSGSGSRHRGRYGEPSGDVAAFVLGLCSLLLCGLAAPFGMMLANNYQKACRRARVRPSGLGTAGMVLSGIGILWMFVQIIYMAVMWKVLMTRIYAD